MPLTASGLIREWIRISEGGHLSQGVAQSVIFRFVACWVSFNAFYSGKYSKAGDAAGVKAAGRDTVLQSFHGDLLAVDPHYLNAAQFFRTAVEDMRYPGDSSHAKIVVNERDWGQVVMSVYQVRCNLIHGDKSIESPRDIECVTNALSILGPMMKKVEGILPS